MSSVKFARANELTVAVRGGGHNVAGNAVCDDGIVIDLSCMRSIRVDPERRTADAEAGARWRDFDHETQAHGLATPGGMVSSTGIAGLTLGGGIGWLLGKHGLTCDNLLSADVVTADGRFLRASTNCNEDLLWGLRGGGGLPMPAAFALPSENAIASRRISLPRIGWASVARTLSRPASRMRVQSFTS